MTTPEGKIKAKVNKLLAWYSPYVYRFMPVQMGMGAPALDYFLCVACDFVAVETKIPGKKLTPRQEQTALAIKTAGGKVFVVYDDNSLAELKRYLDEVFDL
jgi:hypothetical protein